MALTDIKLKNAKPKDKPYKLYDEKGLYIIITPKGSKWWRLDYSFDGKRKTISLGTYPSVSIKEARDKRDEMKKLVKEGIDPKTKKKKADEHFFKDIALEWFEIKKQTWAKGHAETVLGRINKYINPFFGSRKITEITAPDIFNVLHSIRNKGHAELAKRIKQVMSMIFRYAIVKGIATVDPAASLGRDILPGKKVNHYPTLTDEKQIGALMRAIDGYETLITRYALKLLALTFVRPGELRHIEWNEIDLEERVWKIPAEKMKMKKEHLVPLSEQAVNVLKALEPFTKNHSRYVFPSSRDKNRPISDMTLNAALRRMGYNTTEDITSHGFRAMARTVLHEKLNYPPDVIELQLAHAVPDRLGEAYNRTKFFEERKKMMQDWADYLDKVKTLI